MSGKAAAEIGMLLDDSTKKVQDIVASSGQKMEKIVNQAKSDVELGVKKSIECEEILDEVLKGFETVDLSVREVASSAQEQSAGVSQINQAIQEIDNATQQTSLVAGDSSTRSEEVRTESDNLFEIVKEMEIVVFGNASKANTKLATEKPVTLKVVDSKKKRVEPEVPSSDDDRFDDVI